jgi:Glyoxalase-like domain
MQVELDHLFICTAPGAPEAQKLIELGLSEAPPNHHPGQGTANRRFAFSNAMIELLWVQDLAEARNESTAGTKLWERWAARGQRVCPFGICVRPVDPNDAVPPFPGWEYRPAYLPSPLSMYIGEAGIEEPMWVYLSFLTRTQRRQWFHEHPAQLREITRVTLHSPEPPRSMPSQRLVEAGVIHIAKAPSHCVEIEFDRRRKRRDVDFRPDLPLLFDL